MNLFTFIWLQFNLDDDDDEEKKTTNELLEIIPLHYDFFYFVTSKLCVEKQCALKTVRPTE